MLSSILDELVLTEAWLRVFQLDSLAKQQHSTNYIYLNDRGKHQVNSRHRNVEFISWLASLWEGMAEHGTMGPWDLDMGLLFDRDNQS